LIGGPCPAAPVTPASLLRRAFAERIAPAYAGHAGVVAHPDPLRVAVVRAHAQIEGLWRLDAFSKRVTVLPWREQQGRATPALNVQRCA